MRFQQRINKQIANLKAYLIRNDTQITESIELQLQILSTLLSDYYNASDYIDKNGYIQEYNKGTTTALNPLIKLKYESIKLIRKILKDIIPKDNGDLDAEMFLQSLTNNNLNNI